MEKNRLFGLGEPFGMFIDSGEVNEEETFARIKALGVTAMREWMHLPIVLSDPDTVNPQMYETFTRVLNRMKDMDIEVTGLNHEWFLAGEELRRGHNEIYPRDLSEGSLYMQTLELLERSWYTMAKAFPQVEQWEVGNEWNLDTFLHPVGWEYNTPGFSEEEKMDIAVDLMYFSAKGIRRGNPKAKVVSFSPAVTQPNLGGRQAELFCPPAYGMVQAISRVYSRIKSGDFWSTDTNDYFDLIAIHPYMLTQIFPMAASNDFPAEQRFFRSEAPDAGWRAPIDMVYTLMTMNGDGKKQILLTEMGFSDWGTVRDALFFQGRGENVHHPFPVTDVHGIGVAGGKDHIVRPVHLVIVPAGEGFVGFRVGAVFDNPVPAVHEAAPGHAGGIGSIVNLKEPALAVHIGGGQIIHLVFFQPVHIVGHILQHQIRQVQSDAFIVEFPGLVRGVGQGHDVRVFRRGQKGVDIFAFAAGGGCVKGNGQRITGSVSVRIPFLVHPVLHHWAFLVAGVVEAFLVLVNEPGEFRTLAFIHIRSLNRLFLGVPGTGFCILGFRCLVLRCRRFRSRRLAAAASGHQR